MVAAKFVPTLLLLVLLVIAKSSSQIVGTTTTQKYKKKILSFGGNGMIGSETLHRLIETDEYDITLVSRGSWPFDAEDRIAPHVATIVCDREEGLDSESCEDLMEEIDKLSAATDGEPNSYHAVLDFSGFQPTWVVEAVAALQDKARVYIYVSTDSVYEVTEVLPYKDTGKRLVETDAVRPENEEVRENLNEADGYGDEKLQGEEVLRKQRHAASNQGIPFVSLRFADVIGPRDGTERFIKYYTWIKYHHLEDIPEIALPENVVEATSITYVNDAAQSIITAMEKNETWDEAYNIACEEIFNITSAITTLTQIMGQHEIIPDKLEDFDVSFYPSVTKGPMDITKAKDKLGFVPISLYTTLQETVAFYDKLYAESSDFRDDAQIILTDIVRDARDFDSDQDEEDAVDRVLAYLLEAEDEFEDSDASDSSDSSDDSSEEEDTEKNDEL